MCWIYLPNFDMLLNFLKCNYFHKRIFFFSPYITKFIFYIFIILYLTLIFLPKNVFTIYCLLDQLLQESAAGDNNIQDVIDNNIIYISLALQDWLASSTDKVAILSKEDHISVTCLNKNTMCGQCMTYYQDGPAATADTYHSGICICTKI